MKTKIIVGLALVFIPLFLITARYQNTLSRPADLRDSVADTLKSSAGTQAAIPDAGQPRAQAGKAQKLSPLGDLTLQMVAVKGRMERMELSLWNVSRRVENKEGGSLDDSLQTLMGDLKNCTAAARAFSSRAGDAIAKTPKTPDTVAVSKLLLANIAEYTDNDETIATIRFESMMKKPGMKAKLQPYVAEYSKAIEALSQAGDKVMALSGPLQSE